MDLRRSCESKDVEKGVVFHCRYRREISSEGWMLVHNGMLRWRGMLFLLFPGIGVSLLLCFRFGWDLRLPILRLLFVDGTFMLDCLGNGLAVDFGTLAGVCCSCSFDDDDEVCRWLRTCLKEGRALFGMGSVKLSFLTCAKSFLGELLCESVMSNKRIGGRLLPTREGNMIGQQRLRLRY
jgi:hypothetical protein